MALAVKSLALALEAKSLALALEVKALALALALTPLALALALEFVALTPSLEFAAYDLVLSGILFDGLRWLHFHEENAKVNADNFTKYLLTKLADACRLAFQQDIAQRSWNDSDSGSTRQPRLRFTIIIIIIIIMERA